MKAIKYKVLLKLLGLFLGLGLFAQEQAYNLKDPILDPASVIPPAPTVSNLIDFEEIPVNYYTGHCLSIQRVTYPQEGLPQWNCPNEHHPVF
ncbi:MAG: hypothetical protein AAGA66_07750 [Bacteroidota bacterium]